MRGGSRRFHEESVLIQTESSPIPVESRSIPVESRRFSSPEWWEFEAATPINQRFKGLRIAGFICCIGGAVVVIYLGRPPTEQALALLGCTLFGLVFDPFIAIGSVFARASRVILASAVILIGVTILLPVPGMIGACIVWGLVAIAAVKRFNHRYLMQDTFASARNIPDAIRTAPESKAGNAWRHSGAKLANAVAAEIGATCRDHSEIKARELIFYIGYQMADNKTTELARKCERLRLENTLLKDAEKEKSELLEQIEEMNDRNWKDRERANIERQQLIKKIRELEDTNTELVRMIPVEEPESVELKLDYAFRELHMTDREAAEYAGCGQKKAWKYRQANDIEPRGGKT